MKDEVSFSKEDLYCKACLQEAIEKDFEVKKLAEEESIRNPKCEVSIKRQDSGEIFTVIKMGFVVKRLDNGQVEGYIEVKKQIVNFQPAFKPRDTGGAKTVVTYFKENHFKICGNKEKKRKAQEEVDEKQKKKEEVEKMDKYWSALRSKALSVNIYSESDEAFDDPDLNVEQSEIEVVSLPGTSSSISG